MKIYSHKVLFFIDVDIEQSWHDYVEHVFKQVKLQKYNLFYHSKMYYFSERIQHL